MTTVLPNGEIQSNPRIAYNKGYEKGREDQKKADNEFFNFEGAWELEKQKIRADAIAKIKKSVKNALNSYNPSYIDIYNVISELSDVVIGRIEIFEEQLKEQMQKGAENESNNSIY